MLVLRWVAKSCPVAKQPLRVAGIESLTCGGVVIVFIVFFSLIASRNWFYCRERGRYGWKVPAVSCSIQDSSNIYIHALIDCGATGYTFVDEDFATITTLPYTR